MNSLDHYADPEGKLDELITHRDELLNALALAWHALKVADKLVFETGGHGSVSVQLAQARDKAYATLTKVKGEIK